MGDEFFKDTPFEKPKKKLRFRRYKALEVVDLDEDDDDFEGDVELKEIVPKQKRRRKLQSRKKCVQETFSKSQEVLNGRVSLSPELDTVRIYYACSNFIDLDAMLWDSTNRCVRTFVRGLDGDLRTNWERRNVDMRCSWYGKMQVTREVRHYGKNGKNGTPVLCFEYSVAKWYDYTSGLNNGREPSAELLLYPCVQAMYCMNIWYYSRMNFKAIVEHFYKNAEIRRFDLSLNFQVPIGYTPTEYIHVLSRCMLNRSNATIEGDGSISFGTAKSPYRAIFYDKEKEQKHYYLTRDKSPLMYYTDERGGIQSISIDGEKKKFYDLNKDLFKNKLRFEIQFRTKFMQENNLETMGMDNIDNVLRVGALYWREALDQFDEQLGRSNFDTQKNNDVLSNVLQDLDERKERGLCSRTVHANKSVFILDCFRKGWKAVAKELGSDLFSRNRKWVKENLNYDVKVLNVMPIMRIMPTILLSREGKMVRDFVLQPALVQHARLAT